MAFANFLWSTGRREEAEQTIKDAIALEPKHPMANRMLASLFLSTGRTKEAEQPLKTMAEISDAPAARLALAEYYVAMERYKEATDVLSKLAENPAAFAEAEARLASVEYAPRS